MKNRKSSADFNVIDAEEKHYLFIDTSQLPQSGKGLYTHIDIYKDEIISLFKGEILSHKQITRRVKEGQDQYFISTLDGHILDSKRINCFAKYANDVKGCIETEYKNNSKITIDEENNICLTATKKIKSGEEIFCTYGRAYWKKHGLN